LERTGVSEVSAVNVVEVDPAKCCGYGMCAELCPDVFSLDENGFVVANRAEVPEEFLPAAEEAVYSCPEGVLKLTQKSQA
jgi:ferredoxin